MALIKSTRGELSGTIGGEVYSRNRGGAYVRKWTKPTNPNTAAQQAVRSIMAAAIAAWNALSTANKALWDTFAANVAMTNRLGETVYYTGQNQYVRSHCAMARAGLTPVAAGPTVFELPELGEVTVTGAAGVAGTGSLDIAFDGTKDWCDEDDAAMVVYQSTEKNPTVNYFKGPYLYNSNVDGDSVTTPTSPAIVNSLSNLTAGNKVFARLRLIRADGRVSEPIMIGGLIIA